MRYAKAIFTEAEVEKSAQTMSEVGKTIFCFKVCWSWSYRKNRNIGAKSE